MSDDTTNTAPVTGRLAPSPTGRLHLGNLSSSLLAWIQARALGGRVVLRIEDLDPPRCVPGAERRIIEDLRWLGLDWDEGPDVGGPAAPYRQSQRRAGYEAALDELGRRGLVYPCFCSRRDVRDVLSAPHTHFAPGTEYPGTCAGIPADEAAARARTEPHAVRFRATGVVRVVDGVFGVVEHDLAERPGDFVVRRRDGLFAYQLAVVADDAAMQVTDVLRGVDLLDSTPRQMALFDALGVPRPRTWHVPLLVDERGERFSKRAASVARDGLERVGWTADALVGALTRLWGWRDESGPMSPTEAIAAWDPTTLHHAELRVPDAFFGGPDAYAGSPARGPAASEPSASPESSST